MRQITFSVGENPKIMVNGVEYEVLMTDAAIMQMVRNIREKCAAPDAGQNPMDYVLETINVIRIGIEKIIGKGAVKKITGGKEIGLEAAIKLLNLVSQAAVEQWADQLTEMYD